jgi:hypothetical protein
MLQVPPEALLARAHPMQNAGSVDLLLMVN